MQKNWKKFAVMVGLAGMLGGCAKIPEAEPENFHSEKLGKITFVSFKEQDAKQVLYAHKCKHDLNDLYLRWAYYEAAYRIYKDLSDETSDYEISNVDVTSDEIFAGGKGHFVKLDMPDGVDWFDGDRPIQNDQYSSILYDAQNGDFWAGEADGHMTVFAERTKEYQTQGDLLTIIEGEWKEPKYRSVYEMLAGGGWLEELLEQKLPAETDER